MRMLTHYSENFIREFEDKIFWYFLFENQKLSEDFIREFKDRLKAEYDRDFFLKIIIGVIKMQKVTFVMGIPNAGKSTYIKKNFPDYVVLDVLDYQKKIWKDWEFPTVDQIMQSYLDLLEDMKKYLIEGKTDIIVEHTLLRACRREMYLDELKKFNVEKNIICIMVKKEDYTSIGYDENMEVLEYPTIEEGWDKTDIIWR